ncbi:hypothetical protein HYQ46_001185 [Verticillium longisporum]|nr:hypothetical protein HYQ46_001185 [Verticillium longisporum]
MASDGIHERRVQSIIGLEAKRLELSPHVVNVSRVEALLDDRSHKTGKLGLLPALLIGQLGMDKVEALEGVVLLDTAIQMNAAAGASVAQDSGARVDNGQLVAVGRHLELVNGHGGDDGEQSTLWLPALGTAAGMVVDDVAAESDLQGGKQKRRRRLSLGARAPFRAIPNTDNQPQNFDLPRYHH